MKTTLNQPLDYKSLLGKIESKRISLPKQLTSVFIRQHKHLLIDEKNTKKVFSASPKNNFLLLKPDIRKTNQPTKPSPKSSRKSRGPKPKSLQSN